MRVQMSQQEAAALYVWIIGFNIFLLVTNFFFDLGMSVPIPALEDAIRWQFDFREESSLATWYSSALFGLAGIAALACSRLPKQTTTNSPSGSLGWAVLGALLIGFSADEACELHEAVGIAFGKRFGSIPGLTEGLPLGSSFAWLLALLPLILILFVFMIRFFLKILSRHPTARMAAMAGLVCWMGALGLEYAEARMKALGVLEELLAVRGILEESLELFGTTGLFMAAVEYLRMPFEQR